jgi:hypothetical protein
MVAGLEIGGPFAAALHEGEDAVLLGFQFRVLVERGVAHPRLDGGAADGGEHEADRPMEIGLDFPGEIIGDAGAVAGGVGGGDEPLARHIFLRGEELRPALGHEPAELRIGGAGDLVVAVGGGVEGELHVGLSGGEPDVADEDVRDDEAVFAGDDEVEGAGVFRGQVEVRVPAAVGAGDDFRCRLVEGDGDGFAGFGAAPDRGGGRFLEDGVGGKDGGKLDVGGGEDGEEGEEAEAEKEFHFCDFTVSAGTFYGCGDSARCARPGNK